MQTKFTFIAAGALLAAAPVVATPATDLSVKAPVAATEQTAQITGTVWDMLTASNSSSNSSTNTNSNTSTNSNSNSSTNSNSNSSTNSNSNSSTNSNSNTSSNSNSNSNSNSPRRPR